MDNQKRVLSATVIVRGNCASILAAYPKGQHEPGTKPLENPATVFHVRIVEHDTGRVVLEKTILQKDMEATNWLRLVPSYLIMHGGDIDLTQRKQYDIVLTVDNLSEGAKV
ncbi:MAG: hypothetical protein NT031_06720, partial [Planctomycetota bacterium]|nr:hypothetical protein [Planctomycetota bacterium]